MPYEELRSCTICPRNCGIDRYRNRGYCGAPAELMIDMATLHHGEEPPVSGSRGSGTIFFSWCNLRCVFCQNYELSHEGWGSELSTEALAELMLSLQDRGAHNINLVTPTHYSLQIISALELARQQLRIPIVWNSSAYEKVEILQRLSGLVDIWLPDYKYSHGIYAKKYSQAADYPEVAKAALQEMFRQSGHLQMDAQGMAVKGMLVRLLVLPHKLAGTKDSLRMLADTFGPELYLSLMAQYYPAGKAQNYPELNRGITNAEYEEALETAAELGMNNVFIQTDTGSKLWTPKFTNNEGQDTHKPLEIGIHHPHLEQNA